MQSSYFVIELSARWLTALLIALALSLVIAFAFGYGAAWSVLANRQPTPAATVHPTATPMIPGERPTAPPPVATTAVIAAVHTTTPTATTTPRPTSTPLPTATPVPPPTAVPVATAGAAPAPGELLWVQVVASSQRSNLRGPERKLDGIGFGPSERRVFEAEAGGQVLYKLRIGPFADRAAADRAMAKARQAGFRDAWVVVE